MSAAFLLYGATGFAGEATARLAIEYGLQPVLAGRNAGGVRRIDPEWAGEVMEGEK